MVDRALAYGSSTLNFVPTHYFFESETEGVTGYCFMDSSFRQCAKFSEVRSNRRQWSGLRGIPTLA